MIKVIKVIKMMPCNWFFYLTICFSVVAFFEILNSDVNPDLITLVIVSLWGSIYVAIKDSYIQEIDDSKRKYKLIAELLIEDKEKLTSKLHALNARHASSVEQSHVDTTPHPS